MSVYATIVSIEWGITCEAFRGTGSHTFLDNPALISYSWMTAIEDRPPVYSIVSLLPVCPLNPVEYAALSHPSHHHIVLRRIHSNVSGLVQANQKATVTVIGLKCT